MMQSYPNLAKYLLPTFILLLIYCGVSCRYGKKDTNVTTPKPTVIIQKSLDAVGPKSIRLQVKNLVSFADCEAPQGTYTTEIHTTTNGYSYFKQVYSYRDTPFEAITKSPQRGLQILDTLQPLNREAIYTIRSHQFQNLVMEVDHRFHDFRQPRQRTEENLIMINAKDELNHDCALFFDQETKRFSGLDILNPDNESEKIKIRFSDWKPVDGLNLPFRVKIDQNGKMFHFKFSKISINSPGFQMKKADELVH